MKFDGKIILWKDCMLHYYPLLCLFHGGYQNLLQSEQIQSRQSEVAWSKYLEQFYPLSSSVGTSLFMSERSFYFCLIVFSKAYWLQVDMRDGWSKQSRPVNAKPDADPSQSPLGGRTVRKNVGKWYKWFLDELGYKWFLDELGYTT